jgi:hypothetical protein
MRLCGRPPLSLILSFDGVLDQRPPKYGDPGPIKKLISHGTLFLSTWVATFTAATTFHSLRRYDQLHTVFAGWTSLFDALLTSLFSTVVLSGESISIPRRIKARQECYAIKSVRLTVCQWCTCFVRHGRPNWSDQFSLEWSVRTRLVVLSIIETGGIPCQAATVHLSFLCTGIRSHQVGQHKDSPCADQLVRF